MFRSCSRLVPPEWLWFRLVCSPALMSLSALNSLKNRYHRMTAKEGFPLGYRHTRFPWLFLRVFRYPGRYFPGPSYLGLTRWSHQRRLLSSLPRNSHLPGYLLTQSGRLSLYRRYPGYQLSKGMSVPSACRNIPETASIRSVTTELTHVIIPSNIQSSIGYHLHPCLTRMLKWWLYHRRCHRASSFRRR